ncbi:hypothetical protein [Lysobacter soyae]|uniref:Uncharacterized protein n=1 Tax=Lysobacter soyae TaxID=2764185 RepID=A0ABX8WM66_9GAMM|nr:hypothetical protein [Lysobacter sp. CJ11]QYR52710.1 hypothetical protein H8L67_09015 [Lysobacter sp. CJ11]
MTRWSQTQRQYLEAMGYAVVEVVGNRAVPDIAPSEVTKESPREKTQDAPHPALRATFSIKDGEGKAVLLHNVEKVPPEGADEALFTPKLRQSLSRAANMPFDTLAQRVYLPPDLGTNPHAKRAFWHVLKGLRSW